MIKQIENIIEILSKQETDLNIENRQQFKINLSEIYLNLFYYVLYWHFINHDLIIILEEIKNYRNELSHWDKSFNNIWQGLLTDRTNHSIEG